MKDSEDADDDNDGLLDVEDADDDGDGVEDADEDNDGDGISNEGKCHCYRWFFNGFTTTQP